LLIPLTHLAAKSHQEAKCCTQEVQSFLELQVINDLSGIEPPIDLSNNDGNSNVPIHHTQVVQGADKGINLKVKQTKPPEFLG
jgi:hypothetical protein